MTNELIDKQINYQLASTSTIPEVLSVLATDPEINVRERVAANPATPQEALSRLSEDDFTVRYTLAKNPSLPQQIVERLLRDEHVAVRTQAASNPNLSTDYLRRLAENADTTILLGLAINTSTPDVVLALAKGAHHGISRWVLNHPNAPREVIEMKAQLRIRERLLSLLEMEGITEEEALQALQNPAIKAM